MNSEFRNQLLKVTKSTDCQEVEVIQSLWSGYGKISRYQLRGASRQTVVVKHISPSRVAEHPRGWNTSRSHDRKVKSYDVESHWYAAWNQRCTAQCRVPDFIGSFSQGQEHWIILEDLDECYPLRKHQLTLPEVKACVQWLAHFHATFLSQKPAGLWEVGTYWHLDTRPDELEKIEHQELKDKAHAIDTLLNNCTYQTIVHGDAKLANFCFSENGTGIAAVDFQYVGGGCGMKDVAYFLGSCLSNAECELYENELLDFYFSALHRALETSVDRLDFEKMEEEWRRMYPVACADFTRFMLGWMPSHQKINSYNLKMVKAVLAAI